MMVPAGRSRPWPHQSHSSATLSLFSRNSTLTGCWWPHLLPIIVNQLWLPWLPAPMSFARNLWGPDLPDLDAIMAAAQVAQRHVVVNFEFPHMPIFATALQQPGTAAFGRALMVQAWQTVDEWPGTVSGWRAGSETLREFGCHVIDLTMRLFQDKPHRVYARMPRPLGGSTGDLIDMLVLDFPGDRCASIVIDRLCRGPHRYLEMRVDGEHASLRASIGGMARLTLALEPRSRRPGARLELAGGGRLWLEKGETRQPLARNSMKAFHEATASHLEAALEAVAAGHEPQGTISQARPVLEVVEAAYTSARTGTAVTLS